MLWTLNWSRVSSSIDCMTQAPSWLSAKEDDGIMNNSKAFGKMVEVEEQFKAEKKKVADLEKQLEKMTLR